MSGTFSNGRNSSGHSNLIPEQRMDVNGRFVTRHVRADGGTHAPSESLMGQKTAGTEALAGLPANINWEECSPKTIGKMIVQLREDVKDPDRVWENFDLCTSLLASKYGPATFGMIGELKDEIPLAWAKKHGVKLGTEQAYSLEGDDGFKALYAARDELDTELMRARDRRYDASKEEFQVDQEVSKKIFKVAGPSGKSGYGLAGFQRERDFVRSASDAAEERENIKETVDDFIDAVGDAFKGRHDSVVPEGVEGTTASWSDLNPFKGWSRKKEK